MKNVLGTTIGVLLFAFTSHANVSQSFTLDGRLYQAGSSTTPILDTGSFKIQVMGKTPVSAGIYCVLYEENRAYDTTASAGYFSVKVGSALADPARGTADSGNTMAAVFSNTGGAINGKESGDGTTNCTYTPTSGEGRLVRLQVKRSDNSVRTLTPDMAVESVPSAVVAEWAETLQGLPRASVLELGAGQLTQSNVENIFSATNYPRLNQLVSVPPTNYVQSGTNGAAGIPQVSGDPSSGLTAGQFWYDSSINVLKYYDGTDVQAVGVAGSGITSLIAGTGLTGGTISTGGQTIAVDVGPGVGQIVQVQTGGKLPALDGSDLTNLNGSAISTGTIGGNTAVNTTGNITTTGSVTAGSFSSATTGTKTLDIYKSDNSAKVSITANAGQLADYSLVLPVDDGAANQVLATNGAGALSWINLTPTGAASGDLTNNYPNPTVAKIRGNTVATTTPLDGQVYKWNNTASEWQPVYFGADDLMTSAGLQQFATSCTAASKTLTWSAVTDTFTCTDIAITNTQVSGLGTASTKDAGVAAGEVLLLNGSGQVPVGNLPASVVLDGGNATAGAMSVGTTTAQNLSLLTNNSARLTVLSTGEVGIGTATPASKLQVAGGIQIGTDAATCDATKAGAIRYNAGAVEFCNTSAWTALASGSTAISTLNGLTAATQTFATPGTTGVAPNWVSAGSTHTLHVPMASAAGVTAGLISKTDYDAFDTKLTATLPDTQIFVGNGSNVATAVAMSGDATIANTGVVTLKSVGTAGTYYKVTTDAQGRVSSGVASLSLTDLPALNSAKIWVGDGTNVAAPVSVSGDATMDNAGALTVATVGTSTAANIHTAELAANAATANNTASKIVARDVSGNFAASQITSTGIVYNDTQGTPNSVTLQAPNSVTASYTLKFPAGQGGASTVLQNDGSGNLSWVAAASGSVTSVGASAPLSSTGGATPNISIQQADGTHDGYLTQGDWVAFNGKLTSTLADGSIFVGNGSNVATAVAPSGDVALTNAGVMTVNAIKGKTVTAAPTLAGQVLRYDGTDLVPNFVSMRDLRSNVTGSTALAAACTASQTLTYNSVADDLTCSNIAISNTQVSGLGTAALKDAGVAAGEVLLLNGSGQVPVGNLPASVVLDGGNATAGAMSVGTTTAQNLSLLTNNSARLTVLSTGEVGIGTATPASKLQVAGGIQIGTDAATCDATKAGAIRYNAGAVEFCNTSAWTALASGSTAISTLNGLTAATQTFATPGTTGVAPNWVSAGSTHTLHVPMASAAGVTAGLISKTDYDAFNTKLTATLPDTQIFVGNGSNVATAVAMSGDATIANTGVVTLKSVGTAGTYYKVTTDAQGRVSSGVASLSLTDLPALNSAKIWVGDGTNVAAPVSVSGDATMDNAGALTVATVGTSTAANIHTAELAANAATANNTASKIVARDVSGNFAASQITSTGIVYNDTQGTPNSVTLQAPNSVTASYTLKFPAGQGGASTVLQNDGSGNLSWVAAASGSVTSVGASAPLSSTGGATPNISIQQADGTHDGYLTQGDWVAFNGKLTSTLADGSIFVGNGSNVATAVAPSGDVALTNAGVMTVNAIKGKTVTAAPTLAGQVLRYDGTDLVPNFVSMRDLRSNVTGSTALAAACTASQTLTYNSVADDLTCSNIAISNTQVSGLGTAALKDAGVAAGEVLLLNGSGQVPVGNLPASVVLDGGNATAGAMSVGTTTAQNLSLLTNNSARLTVLSTGEVGIGTATPASKLQVAGGIQIGTDAATCDATKAGAIRYNAGAVEFCNTSAWTALASGSTAISTLNGLTAATQTFATPGTTGVAPNWVSAGSTHTLHVPMASAAGVTAGLISKTDYDAFNTKLTATLPDTQIFVGNGSNVATAVAMSGDATIANTGVVTLKSVGTAGTYYKVTTDAQGRVSSGVASLSLTDLPALNSAKIWVGDGTNVAAPVSVSGDATMDNAGALTVATVGTSTAANIHTAELAANAATANNTASKIVARDVSGNFAASQITSTGIVYNDTQGTPNSVTLQAPNSVTASYTLKFPAGQGGASTVLQNDGSGNLSWVAAASGSVTSVGASAPLSSTGGATPNISIQQADGTHDGYLTQGDWVAFNGKLTSTLADGSIFVGNGSNVATAVAPSGDVALTNAGVMTVNAIKGKTVTAAPTLAGQVLRYDGTDLVPNFVSMRDLRSNVTGSTALAAACTASQTLTYNSVADDLTCSNIAISNTQVSGLGTAALKDAGVAAGEVLLLNGSGQVPVGNLPASVVLDGGNAPGATLSIGTTNANSLSLVTNGSSRLTITSGGNVGIGVTPGSNTKLDVNGQIRAPASSTASGSLDFVNGNSVTTSFDCGSNISLANIRDGGSYTIVVTGTGTAQCSFGTSTTGDDAATVSYRFQPANGVRIASSHTIYSLLRVGNVVYVAWITGF